VGIDKARLALFRAPGITGPGALAALRPVADALAGAIGNLLAPKLADVVPIDRRRRAAAEGEQA
jgi:hypothetical protein